MAYLPQERTITGFNEKRTASRTPVVSLNGSKPLSALRDDQQTSGTGAISASDSEFRVRHAATGDFARLASTARGGYQPGSALEVGIGVRLDTASISGDGVGYWGYFDMDVSSTENVNDGFVFGLDSTGLFVQVIKSGTSKHKTYSDSFNITPNPGITLTDGNIFQIDFTYYGYGLIKFQLVEGDTADGTQRVTDLHTVRLTGETSIGTSNLQVGALAKSTTTTGDFSIFVGGRHISVVGPYNPQRRISTGRVEGKSVGTSGFIPILSFRKKSGFRQIASDIFGYVINSDQDGILQTRVNADLTNASFGSLNEQPDSETSLELDTSATAVDTGTGVKVYETLIGGGANPNPTEVSTRAGVFTDIPDEGTITFALSVDTSATVDFIGQIEEIF